MLQPALLWRLSTLAVAILIMATQPLSAQIGKPSIADSTLLAQRRSNAVKILAPARFALEKRTELGLNAGQVTALQKLAVALDDSAGVRRYRTMKLMQSRDPASSATAKAAASWVGPIDESGITGDFCQQAQYQADAMIGLVRDRHMVGAVLTPAQRTQLEQIFAASVNPPSR